MKVDRLRKDLSFITRLARGTVLGTSTISEQARSIPTDLGRAVAGVNGDFFEREFRNYAGDPRGLQIVDGELVSAPSTDCLWFDGAGNAQLGEVKGDFKVTWPDGRQTAFGLNQQRRSNMVVLYTPTYGPSTRVAGGRDFILEKEGGGPWLPLAIGETYHARIREITTNGNTQLTANRMVVSLGPQLLAATASPPGSGLPPGPQTDSKTFDFELGAALLISTAAVPDLKGVKTAIAGGPVIIKDGQPFALKVPSPEARVAGFSEISKYQRHPRSAAGWNSTHFYLVTVDGRQPGSSVGMTLAELAAYMVKLGCTDALNFDGGASASLWMSGHIVNKPCQGERPVANSLWVVRKADAK